MNISGQFQAKLYVRLMDVVFKVFKDIQKKIFIGIIQIDSYFPGPDFIKFNLISLVNCPLIRGSSRNNTSEFYYFYNFLKDYFI